MQRTGSDLGDATASRKRRFFVEVDNLAFDETHPGAVGRGEMDVKARTLGEPVPDERRFVRAVVVHDDVHVESPRHPLIDQVEKLAKLRGSVPLMKLSDHVARLRIERGKQGRGAMTLVVMRPAFHLPGCIGSNGCVRSSA